MTYQWDSKLILYFLLLIAEPTKPPTPLNPCDPSPCGSNAQCRIENRSYAVCECLPEYQGNPYEGCRPECVVSSDCPTNKACLKNKCLDPCPGTCGLSAICTVSNHIPICSCPPGYTGDAFTRCEQIPQKGQSTLLFSINILVFLFKRKIVLLCPAGHIFLK